MASISSSGRVVKLAGSGIIIQHCAHLFLSLNPVISLNSGERIIGADIELLVRSSTDGADTCYEATFDRRISACFHRIEEAAQITCSVSVCFYNLRGRKVLDRILFGKVVVFINEQINLLGLF